MARTRHPNRGGSIQVLHVDDEPDFVDMAAEFLEREVERLAVETATSASDSLDLLADTDYDCIVSDYDMPHQDGIEFLEVVREDYPDLPFILYTGKGSEEVASEAISAGVTDYLQKETGTSQYTVLANRIANAVDSFRTERALEATRRRYERVVEQNLAGIYIIQDWEFVYVNPKLAEIHGYEQDEIIGMSPLELVTPEERDRVQEKLQKRLDGEVKDVQYQTVGLTKDGEHIDIELHGSRLENSGKLTIIGAELDITERKQRERELQEAKAQLEATVSETERQNQAFDAFLDIVNDSTLSFDKQITEVLDLAVEFLGLDIGILSHIDPPDYTVECVVPPDGPIEQGAVLDFSNTFCSLVYEADGPVMFHSPAEGGVKDHPAYQDLGLEAYVGEPLVVEGNRYGTLNFSSPNARDEPFTDGERAFVRSLCEWVTTELSRHRRIQDLEQFKKAVENSGHAVYTTDVDGTIKYVNPAFERITGYSAERAVGQTPNILNSGEMKDEYFENLWETLLAGNRWEEEVINRRQSGDLYTAHQTIAPITDDSGEPTAFVAIQADISDRKEREAELRRERSRLNALFQNSIDAIAFTEFIDGEPIVRDVNAAFKETFGYDRESAIGRPIDDLVVPDAADKRQEATDLNGRIEAGERVVTEVRRQTVDGVRDFLLQSTPLEPGENSRYSYAIYSDISERKERERELQRQNERLGEFASVVSHDLRNPLNVADGRLKLAREQRDWGELDAVAQALDRMETLIEDLLSIAKAGEDVGEIETVELAELVESCWQNVPTESATFRIETDASIQADKSRLQQLIENLLRNTVENGGSEVAVTVGDLPDGFYVEDDGPGIPKDERDAVLKPGYSSSDEGTGFGLSIVRDIAHAHGWELRIADGNDGGARFEFTGVETA